VISGAVFFSIRFSLGLGFWTTGEGWHGRSGDAMTMIVTFTDALN
jgi:hypothetical protein